MADIEKGEKMCQHSCVIVTLHGSICGECGELFKGEVLVDTNRQTARPVSKRSSRLLKIRDMGPPGKLKKPLKSRYIMSQCGELLNQIEPSFWRECKDDVEDDMQRMNLASNSKVPEKMSIMFLFFYTRFVRSKAQTRHGFDELRQHLQIGIDHIEEAASFMAFFPHVTPLTMEEFLHFEIDVVFRSINLQPTDYEWIEKVWAMTPKFASFLDAVPVKAACSYWLEFNYGLVHCQTSRQIQFLIDHIAMCMSSFSLFERDSILDFLEEKVQPQLFQLWPLFFDQPPFLTQ